MLVVFAAGSLPGGEPLRSLERPETVRSSCGPLANQIAGHQIAGHQIA
jgi:hypothetical protein